MTGDGKHKKSPLESEYLERKLLYSLVMPKVLHIVYTQKVCLVFVKLN